MRIIYFFLFLFTITSCSEDKAKIEIPKSFQKNYDGPWTDKKSASVNGVLQMNKFFDCMDCFLIENNSIADLFLVACINNNKVTKFHLVNIKTDQISDTFNSIDIKAPTIVDINRLAIKDSLIIANKKANEVAQKKADDAQLKLEADKANKWMNSKAGKLLAKHPNWSKEDCEKVANGKIWIGMSIDMVKAQFGRPTSKNVSNYGKGNEYQYCWNDYEPSCFYCKSDGIVYAYN